MGMKDVDFVSADQNLFKEIGNKGTTITEQLKNGRYVKENKYSFSGKGTKRDEGSPYNED